MNKENCALYLVDEIILYYDARSRKYKKYREALLYHLSLNIPQVITSRKDGGACGTYVRQERLFQDFDVET